MLLKKNASLKSLFSGLEWGRGGAVMRQRRALVLGEAVVHKQHARVRVDIRVGVARLAVLGEHARHHLRGGARPISMRG